MEEQTLNQLESFLNLASKIKSYHEAIGLLHWDLRTGAPKKGVPTRSETIGMLSTEAFKLQTSDEMKTYLDTLTKPEVLNQLDDINRRLVLECKRNMIGANPSRLRRFKHIRCSRPNRKRHGKMPSIIAILKAFPRI